MINLKVAMNEKKVKEGSLGSSTDDADVFSEGLESADWKPFFIS